MKQRKKKILGYLLVLIGTLLPTISFVSMAYRFLSSEAGYQSFRAQASEMPESEYRDKLNRSEEYNQRISQVDSIIDPWIADSYEASYSVFEDTDSAFAYISIPKIQSIQPIYLGADMDHLWYGFGHVAGTDLPIGGLGIRTVIAGHRGVYSDQTLFHADYIEPGDRAYIDLGGELLAYEMVSSEIVDPSEWEKLAPDENLDMLTLLTCEPKWTSPRTKRLLVNFVRVEDEDLEAEIAAYYQAENQDEPIDQVDRQIASTKSQTGSQLTWSNKDIADVFYGHEGEDAGKAKLFNIGILAVAGIGSLAFILVFIRFVKFLLSDKNKEK